MGKWQHPEDPETKLKELLRRLSTLSPMPGGQRSSECPPVARLLEAWKAPEEEDETYTDIWKHASDCPYCLRMLSIWEEAPESRPIHEPAESILCPGPEVYRSLPFSLPAAAMAASATAPADQPASFPTSIELSFPESPDLKGLVRLGSDPKVWLLEFWEPNLPAGLCIRVSWRSPDPGEPGACLWSRFLIFRRQLQEATARIVLPSEILAKVSGQKNLLETKMGFWADNLTSEDLPLLEQSLEEVRQYDPDALSEWVQWLQQEKDNPDAPPEVQQRLAELAKKAQTYLAQVSSQGGFALRVSGRVCSLCESISIAADRQRRAPDRIRAARILLEQGGFLQVCVELAAHPDPDLLLAFQQALRQFHSQPFLEVLAVLCRENLRVADPDQEALWQRRRLELLSSAALALAWAKQQEEGESFLWLQKAAAIWTGNALDGFWPDRLPPANQPWQRLDLLLHQMETNAQMPLRLGLLRDWIRWLAGTQRTVLRSRSILIPFYSPLEGAGRIFRFQAELLADGAGQLYVNPVFWAQTNLSKELMNTIDSIWSFVAAEAEALKTCDLSWSIQPLSQEQTPPWLMGASLGAGAAAALASLLRNQPIDPSTLITAGLGRDGNFTEVAHVYEKLQALPAVVHQVLVHPHNQSEAQAALAGRPSGTTILLETACRLDEAIQKCTSFRTAWSQTAGLFTVGALRLRVYRILGGDGLTRLRWPDGIQTRWTQPDYQLPPELQAIKDPILSWKAQRSAQRGALFQNNPQVRLCGVHFTTNEQEVISQLILQTARCWYFDNQLTNAGLAEPDRAPEDAPPQWHDWQERLKALEMPVPLGELERSCLANPLAVNLSVVTADRKIFLARRSTRVAFNPLGFGPAVSGNANPDLDLDSQAAYDPFATACREASQELLGRLALAKADSSASAAKAPLQAAEPGPTTARASSPLWNRQVVTFFGLARTVKTRYPFLFGEIRLPCDAQTLLAQVSSDSWENSSWIAIDFTIPAVVQWIRWQLQEGGQKPFGWDTAVFSLLQSLLYEYPDQWMDLVEQLQNL
ncbi:MAG: hypothetical protein NZ602_09640 [Thermoguttaceae bacterium]|nr:hypothetical protein [Thermoguttaceae bacterium]MDW8038736.1 hypothetical protein [Thermoguttaceae bacterium]